MNDNEAPDFGETLARLAWVRPIAVAMRAQNLPDSVIQPAMTDVLKHLDNFLDNA